MDFHRAGTKKCCCRGWRPWGELAASSPWPVKLLLANELLANELLANELLANELLANELLANELLANESC